MKQIDTSYHEAGHLVARIVLHLRPMGATIIRNDDSYGKVVYQYRNRRDYTQQEIEEAWFNKRKLKSVYTFDDLGEDPVRLKRNARRHIISCLAGYVAEKKHNPAADIENAKDDFITALRIAEIAFNYDDMPEDCLYEDGSPDYYRFLEIKFIPLTEKFISKHWQEITYTAELLAKRKTFDEKDIIELRLILKEIGMGLQ